MNCKEKLADHRVSSYKDNIQKIDFNHKHTMFTGDNCPENAASALLPK